MDPVKVVGLVEKLIPPADGDPHSVFIWRMYVAVATLLNSLVLGFHIAWACGIFPGVQGFALAADVQDVKTATAVVAKLVLEQRIFDMKIRQCEAAKNEEPSAVLRAYAEKMVALKEQYLAVVGKEAKVPECSEL